MATQPSVTEGEHLSFLLQKRNKKVLRGLWRRDNVEKVTFFVQLIPQFPANQ